MIYYIKKIKKQQDPKHIPLIFTYNQFLLNLTEVVPKNWNFFQTNKYLWELFQEHPITAFTRNKNLKEIIECTHIENPNVKKFNIPSRTGRTGKSKWLQKSTARNVSDKINSLDSEAKNTSSI